MAGASSSSSSSSPPSAIERRERTLRFWQTMLAHGRADGDANADTADGAVDGGGNGSGGGDARRATLRLFDSTADVDGVVAAVDAAPTTLVVRRLRTPIGEYSSARVRMSDVVAVEFDLRAMAAEADIDSHNGSGVV
jgi:hypothetical protein